jgi:hypothetical protein
VLAVLPAVAAVCAVEIVRRGFGAPVLYGVRCWWAAVHREPCDHELDYLA